MTRDRTRLLALDVGNTTITVGVFSGRRLVRVGRVPSGRARGLGERVARCAGRPAAEAVVYASVVPRLDRALERAMRKATGARPCKLGPRSAVSIRLRVKQPGQVGADRIANALAAHRLYGGPAVVVDFGTATTLDCVSRRGEYLGGAILPGPRMAAEALAARTAKLPLVSIRRPARAIGRDTVECLQGGLYFGYLGMIEKLLALSAREMGGKPKVILTGGYAALYARDLPGAVLDPTLTLKGLRLAYDEMRGGDHGR